MVIERRVGRWVGAKADSIRCSHLDGCAAGLLIKSTMRGRFGKGSERVRAFENQLNH